MPDPPGFEPEGFRCYQDGVSKYAGPPGTLEHTLPPITRGETSWILCERDTYLGNKYVQQRLAFWTD